MKRLRNCNVWRLRKWNVWKVMNRNIRGLKNRFGLVRFYLAQILNNRENWWPFQTYRNECWKIEKINYHHFRYLICRLHFVFISTTLFWFWCFDKIHLFVDIRTFSYARHYSHLRHSIATHPKQSKNQLLHQHQQQQQ